MMSITSETKRPDLWTPGDWNAFFGFGTNILVNMLVLTGLLRFVLKMPDSLVFGRILPALGLMMCLSTMYYAFLAYRLALKTGRSDVCALPSGVSVIALGYELRACPMRVSAVHTASLNRPLAAEPLTPASTR